MRRETVNATFGFTINTKARIQKHTDAEPHGHIHKQGCRVHIYGFHKTIVKLAIN